MATDEHHGPYGMCDCGGYAEASADCERGEHECNCCDLCRFQCNAAADSASSRDILREAYVASLTEEELRANIEILDAAERHRRVTAPRVGWGEWGKVYRLCKKHLAKLDKAY